MSMSRFGFMLVIVCVGMSLVATPVYSQSVTLGTWLEEGTGSVAGSGDSFTASPLPNGIADNGDNFDARNLARHRVYQTFGQPVDFSSVGDEIQIVFDLAFSGNPNSLDTGFRMSLVDTSTNQGFYPLSFDTGGRVGTYNRSRFVDNLDGSTSDAHRGTFEDAINGSGTIASTGATPTIMNGAAELGLVDGNTVSFSVLMTRNAGDSFSFTTNASEAAGDVVYGETAGAYDPVNPTLGDTSVANIAVNNFDGIVFGLFDDNPFDSAAGSYTVSNLSITTAAVPEPHSMALLVATGVSFSVRRRRRR